MPGDQDREWVDDKELAEIYPIARPTWQGWRARGEGPPWYKVGKRVLYRRSEVEEWIRSQRAA